MADKTKIRLRRDGQATEILALVVHPMSGSEQLPNAQVGNTAPNFIERMDFSINGNSVAEVFFSPQVASNPLTTISVDGMATGDTATVRWQDTQGRSGEAEATNR